MNDESTEGLDPTEVDLVSLVNYMLRNNLVSVKVRLESLKSSEEDASSKVLVDVRGNLTDDALPSDLGLEGVFIVATA